MTYTVYWNTIKRFFGNLETLPKVAFVFLGCGFARAWLWWALTMICNTPAFPDLSAQEGHLLFDAGEVIGFFGLSVLAFRASPFFKRPSVLVAAVILMLLCSGTILFALEHEINSAVANVIILLGGLGYAFMLLLWLELFGCLTTRNMIIAWTGSFFVGLFTWFIFESSQFPVASVLMGALPLVCAFMVLRGFWKLPEKALPNKMSTRPQVPWKLAVVLSTFALAFGIGDVITGLNMFTTASRLGMAIPELIILVGVIFFAKHLTLRHLISAASLFIVAGLVFAFFSEGSGIAPFILMNMSSEIYLILSYAIACAIGHQSKTSAVYLAGLFACLYKIFLQVGKSGSSWIIDTVHSDSITLTILGAVVILMTVAVSITLIQDRNIIEKISWKQQGGNSEHARHAIIIEEYKLTPKEASVLLLLSKGLDSAEIAEELFVAQSTVRVHTSSIYKKMNIHSRKELANVLQDNTMK